MKKLIDLLPNKEMFRGNREYEAILNALDPEMESISKACEKVLNSAFIDSTDEDTVALWEDLLGIKPKGDDTLEDRQFRVKTAWAIKTPFSMPALIDMLTTLCGPRDVGFTVEMLYKSKVLNVGIGVASRSQLESVGEYLTMVKPLPVKLNLYLIHKSWSYYGSKGKTWDDMSGMTWEQAANGESY